MCKYACIFPGMTPEVSLWNLSGEFLKYIGANIHKYISYINFRTRSVEIALCGE